LNFERRDIILIVGLILVMLALIQYLGPAYSAIIVIGLYFGIKIYVGKKRQLIQRDVGEGICMECGSKIINKKCTNCDSGKE
jgi:disulfide bond formation protein DsbB